MIRKLVLPSLLSLALPAGAAFVPAAVETTGESVTTTVLSDQSTVVTFLADGTLTLTDDVTARALFVGGGGGGGSGVGGGGGGGVGGGGGGGGVVELESLELAAGTYAISVGAGGAGGTSKAAGSNGGDSTMTFGGQAVSPLLPALGGGRGAGWDYYTAHTSGGSGGGSCNGQAGKAGTPGQGYAAGKAGSRSSGGGGVM